MTLKQVHDSPSSQDAITHRTWDYNNRHAKDTIILENRSEIKVTAIEKWFVTICNPKIQIWDSFLKEYK